MDRPGDQFLAGTALTGDQNGRSAGRRLDDEVEHLLHARAAADDGGKALILRLQVLPQHGILGHQLPPLDGVAHDHQHFVVLERLRDVVERTALHRGNRRLYRRERRDHQNRQLVVQLLQLLEQREPVHAWHHHVGDDGIEGKRSGQLEPFFSCRGYPDVIALAREQTLENLTHDFFVVDYEDRTTAPHR
jgi:hypothetical protein